MDFAMASEAGPSTSGPSQVGPPLDLSTTATLTPAISMPETEDEVHADAHKVTVKIRTGLVYSSVMMLHAHPGSSTSVFDDHPEAPERIAKAFSVLKENGCVKRMKRINPREVTRTEVALVHDVNIWEGLYASQFHTRSALVQVTSVFGESASIYLNEHTFRSARLSCGGVMELCDAVCSGTIRNGFAIVRPPGHHAEPDRSMGFCLFNNVAVAARWIKEKYGGDDVPKNKRIRKILILDWDVHHGNGTQKAFEEDDEVLYISLHRYEDGTFYPGTDYGRSGSVGSGRGKGYSVNIPWPGPAMGDGEYLYAFHQVVMPIAAEFGPDLIIISAGFDAARGDPLGGCYVSPIGYAQMTYMLMGLANGKVVVALEGGYNVEALATSALAVTRTLLGDPVVSHASLPSACAPAVNAVNLVKRDIAPYWKCVKKSPLDPVPAEEEGLPRTTIAELIRSHRQYEVANKFDLSELPVIGNLANDWGGHALGSADLMGRLPPHEAIVLFAHDMGDLRAGNEQPNLALTPESETAYLVDSSSLFLEWVHRRDFAVVDVNLFTEASSAGRPASNKPKTRGEYLGFIWDNYVDLSDCSNIVLIGHAGAAKEVLSLVERYRLDKDDRVAAMCLTLGSQEVPMIPKNEPELRKWYMRNGRVFLPETHTWWIQDEITRKRNKRAGRIIQVPEVRAIQVLRAAFTDLITFIETKLAPRTSAQAAAADGPSPAVVPPAIQAVQGVIDVEAQPAPQSQSTAVAVEPPTDSSSTVDGIGGVNGQVAPTDTAAPAAAVPEPVAVPVPAPVTASVTGTDLDGMDIDVVASTSTSTAQGTLPEEGQQQPPS